MPWETVIEHGLISVGIHIAGRLRRVRFVKCRLLQPSVDMRVAFSALLRLARGGQYILVRNLHRPEMFGPFGGVFKYLEFGKRELDEMQFKPQDIGPGTDMKDDLRGFLPRRFLPKLCKWYLSSEARETPGACIYRELCEELDEAGLSKKIKPPPAMSLRRVRTIEEGPEPVQGQRYTQYRIFEVYEPVVANSTVEKFVNKVFDNATANPSLLIVNAEEILKGRAADDNIIGHHAVYLITGKRIRGEDPPFARRVPADM